MNKNENTRNGKEVSRAAMERFAEEKRSQRKTNEECVTPDMLVSCPKCGYRFRVGRRIAA